MTQIKTDHAAIWMEGRLHWGDDATSASFLATHETASSLRKAADDLDQWFAANPDYRQDFIPFVPIPV